MGKGEKGINRYTINDKVLDKVGGKQLEEIVKMGFKSVAVGNDEMNPWLASQFFPIFLLDKPGSQVTDFISEVSRLNVLQDAILLAARGKKKSNDLFNSKTLEAKEYSAKLGKLKDIQEVDDIQVDLEEQLKSINEYEAKVGLLKDINEKLKKNANSIKSIMGVNKVEIPDIIPIDELTKVKTAKDLLNKLNGIVRKIIPIKKISTIVVPNDIAEFSKYSSMKKYKWVQQEKLTLQKLSKVSDLVIPTSDMPELLQLQVMKSTLSKITGLKSKIFDTSKINIPDLSIGDSKNIPILGVLKGIHDSIKSENDKCVQLNNDLDSVNKQLEDIEKEINSIPICPTCSRPCDTQNHPT